jgi:polynucleotide 5'-kinase involved in rRNA processing
VPEDWAEAIHALGKRRRMLVLGAADAGKTSFIRALSSPRTRLALIDLDPGQKMIGPPGTLGFGSIDALERFVFIGSTRASSLSAIWRGAETLARTRRSFVVNTAGFIKGIGARLQAGTITAIRPYAIVLIGEPDGLDALLAAHPNIPLLRLNRSPLARRKSAGERRRLRQAAFEEALREAETIPMPDAFFAPAPPRAFESAARPVCALGDAEGRYLSYGLLLDSATMLVRRPHGRAATVRLGKMWAEPLEGGWRLRDTLDPAWSG